MGQAVSFPSYDSDDRDESRKRNQWTSNALQIFDRPVTVRFGGVSAYPVLDAQDRNWYFYSRFDHLTMTLL